ncbi:hypothetical protein C8R43DRAFT_957106 [Mycena crocata]|nr:hypothetical protein C8R43DRAFT_957106 [Mycena crocata]
MTSTPAYLFQLAFFDLLFSFAAVSYYLPSQSVPNDIGDARSLNDIGPDPIILNVEDEAKLRSLGQSPYSLLWKDLFDSLDLLVLFKLCLRSKPLFYRVMEHVEKFSGDYCHTDEIKCVDSPSEHIGTLNTDVFEEVMSYLSMRDRFSFGRTAKKYRAVAGRALQASVAALLRSFGLSHTHIRFMQTATSTIISGDAIPFLFNPSSRVSSLLFLTPHDLYLWVIDFFRKATTYVCDGSIKRHKRSDGIAHSRCMVNRDLRSRITIARSWSSSALDPLSYSNLSHRMGGITHYGLWHANPGTTLQHVTIPSADELHLGSFDSRVHAREALTECHRRGWKVVLHTADPHSCGSSFSCPSTDRHTADSGCMHLFFPGNPYGCSPLNGNVYPMGHSVAWSLGGPTFPSFLATTTGLPIMPRVGSRLANWTTRAIEITDHINAYLGPIFDEEHF